MKTYEEGSDDAEERARMTDDESYSPQYHAKAAKREVKVKGEESEPIFATHKLNRFGQKTLDGQRRPPRGAASSPSNQPPRAPPVLPISSVIDELVDLAGQFAELAADSVSDETTRRDPAEPMRNGGQCLLRHRRMRKENVCANSGQITCVRHVFSRDAFPTRVSWARWRSNAIRAYRKKRKSEKYLSARNCRSTAHHQARQKSHRCMR